MSPLVPYFYIQVVCAIWFVSYLMDASRGLLNICATVSCIRYKGVSPFKVEMHGRKPHELFRVSTTAAYIESGHVPSGYVFYRGSHRRLPVGE